jgi:hypothetical protein
MAHCFHAHVETGCVALSGSSRAPKGFEERGIFDEGFLLWEGIGQKERGVVAFGETAAASELLGGYLGGEPWIFFIDKFSLFWGGEFSGFKS